MNPETVGEKRKSHRTRNFAILLVVLGIATVWIVLYLVTLTLYGCFCGGTARISVEPVSCAVRNDSCELLLSNTGTTSVQAQLCYFVSGNVTIMGTLTDKQGGTPVVVTLPAGVDTTVFCSPSIGPTSGAQAVGYVELSNGAKAPFSSIWG